MTISCSVHRIVINFPNKSCMENQNTFYVQQLFLENRVIYKIIWKSMAEPDMPQMTNIIWCMHFACWITKATHTPPRVPTTQTIRTCARMHAHTHKIHNIYCFSMTTMIVQTCLNVTLYIYCLSCWKCSVLQLRSTMDQRQAQSFSQLVSYRLL